MMNGLTVNDFFCGAGGMGLGFKQAGFTIEGAWDFDKYAVESYRHNVGDHVEQADISKMDWIDVPKADVWTFGFPCQDLSVAGKQAGMIKGKTRSGLFFEIMRLLGEIKEKIGMEYMPKVIMAENVKGLKPYLPVLEEEYEQAGYKLYLSKENKGIFNSKYWGVPQNRERYFVVGIRNDIPKEFVFPSEQHDFIPKLSSVLEENVDEKYYISDEKAAKIIEQAKEGLKVRQATKKGYDIAVEGGSINISHPNSKTRRGRVGKQVAQTLLTGTEQVVVESLGSVHACITPDRVDKRQNGRRAKEEEPMFTVTAQDLHGIIVAGSLDHYGNDQMNRVYSPEGVSPTALVVSGGGREIKILEESQPSIITVGNTNPSGRGMNGNVISEEGISTALTTNKGEGHKILTVSYNRKDGIEKEIDVAGALTSSDWRGLNQNQSKAAVVELEPTYRVRKLTPREYARLQGFPDSYEQVVSNSQFYKQMGNAVTVNVAEAIATAIKEFLYDC